MLLPPYSSSFGWYMAREGAVEPVADIVWLHGTPRASRASASGSLRSRVSLDTPVTPESPFCKRKREGAKS